MLRQARTDGLGAHARLEPAPALLPFIDCYWMVRWDLRGHPPFLAETLPHPCVYWATERGDSTIGGVADARFTRRLEGRGRVFGVRFRPGGFYPFYRRPLAGLTGRTVSLREVFGAPGAALRRELVALDRAALAAEPTAGHDPDAAADEAMMDRTDQFLLARLPAADPRLAEVSTIVHTIATTPGLTRVETVAARFGTTVRSLQRLFSQWVGVSPKWVIKRYRLHEAIAQAEGGAPVSWSRLALELGYADQAHFNRDFKALVGRSPGEYRREVAQTPRGGP